MTTTIIRDLRNSKVTMFENIISKYNGQPVSIYYHGFTNFDFINEKFTYTKTNDCRYIFGTIADDGDIDIDFSLKLEQIADIKIDIDEVEQEIKLYLLNGDQVIIDLSDADV